MFLSGRLQIITSRNGGGSDSLHMPTYPSFNRSVPKIACSPADQQETPAAKEFLNKL